MLKIALVVCFAAYAAAEAEADAKLMLDFCMELMDTQDLDIMARDPLMLNPRLNQRLRLMLDFFMEDMDMVLVWDIEVLDMLDTDMVLDLMDILDLDITARDPL